MERYTLKKGRSTNRVTGGRFTIRYCRLGHKDWALYVDGDSPVLYDSDYARFTDADQVALAEWLEPYADDAVTVALLKERTGARYQVPNYFDRIEALAKDADELAVLRILLRYGGPVPSSTLEEETRAQFDVFFLAHRKAVRRLSKRGIIRWITMRRAWHLADERE